MRNAIRAALGAFLIAAATGVLLRFGLFQGMPSWAQNFSAIRHAHSHLMYFGWGTLAIMAMIWRLLPRWTSVDPPHATHWHLGVTALAALLSFAAFWRNGYGLTQIGTAELPLGSMAAGVNGILWLLFILLYWRATAHLTERPLPLRLWDWAMFMLLLACSGAMGLVALVMLDLSNVFLQQAMLHLFLEIFATGWFTLSLLGLLWAWIAQQSGNQSILPRRLPTGSLALCLAPTFFIGMSPALVPLHTFWISALANGAAALLLAWHGWALWARRDKLPPLARFALLALGVHLLMALVLLWPGVWRWSAGTQLRIFYLHNLLLGWLSSGLLGIALALWFPTVQPWRRIINALWMGGVAMMLLALLGLGLAGLAVPVSPLAWLRLAAWSSVVVAATIGLIVVRALLPVHEKPHLHRGAAHQSLWLARLVDTERVAGKRITRSSIGPGA